MKSASAAKLTLVVPVVATGSDTMTGYRAALTNLFNVRLPGRVANLKRDQQKPKYVTIGYGDEAGYNRTAPQVRDAAHAQDRVLVRSGALVGMAGSPVQVRNPDDSGVQIQAAAFMSSPLPIAGFAIIEAANLDEAIKLVAKNPCTVAHGVVEIWPLGTA